ncbi:MAG: hybrid sensor histidine kinase/response regulator [Novosphingobium sp.]
MAELRARLASAEAANEAKSRFLANVSHEIRSPLNAIYGYAQLVERGADVDPLAAARVIRRSAEHLTNLVEGLLDIASVEQGVVRIDNSVVRLNALVEQVAEMFAPLASSKGLAFDCEIPPRLPEFVRLDERRVRQALINLVSNAVKFTQRGKVRLVLRWSGQIATIEVHDTGPGIATERQERIFAPYERADAASDADKAGAGLGLAITRAIASMLGGDLRLDSTLGQGSCFTLQLMAPQVSGMVDRAAKSARPSGYTGVRRSVLLVDDDADHLCVLRTTLAEVGFDVMQACDGATAIELAAVQRFDAVVCDVSMPGMSGWEVTERLRARFGRDLLILMLSANAFERHGLTGQQASHDAFVLKPVELDALIDTLGRHLRLEWVMPRASRREATNGSGIGISEAARDHAARIRSFQQIGHVRAIEDEIKALATSDPAAAPMAARLFDCLDRFDLAGIGRILEDLPDEWR